MDSGNCICKNQVLRKACICKNQVARVESEKIAPLVTCGICNELFKEATTINLCLHTFCKVCINKKLREEKKKSCPVCGADLGLDPQKYLRADEMLNSIATQLMNSIRENYKQKKNEEKTREAKMKNKQKVGETSKAVDDDDIAQG